MLNNIYVSDCNIFMDGLPGNYIDLTVTSPPYDKLRKYEGFVFDFEETAKHLFRITKLGGVLVWVVGDQTIKGSESGNSFRQALYFMSLGFNLHDTMIYKKNTAPLNHNRYEQDFEYMFVFAKGKPNVFNPIKIPCTYYGRDSDRTGQRMGLHGEINKRLRSGKDRTNIKEFKIKGNIWEYAVGFNKSTLDKIAFNHPAIFPEKLAEDHIRTWSKPLDIVFDPFNGSGTTAKEAKKLGRYFLGCDITEKYVADSLERLSTIDDQTYMLS